MIGTTNLKNASELERLRRSVAMLSPGSATFNREEGLTLILTIGELLAEIQEEGNGG